MDFLGVFLVCYFLKGLSIGLLVHVLSIQSKIILWALCDFLGLTYSLILFCIIR